MIRLINRYSILLMLIILLSEFAGTKVILAQDIIIQNDNGIPRTNYSERAGWEESVFLVPDGPCQVKELQIYYAGTKAAKDTVYIVGDPAEGTIPPTFWVLHYNMKHAPIIIDYDGKPGWRSIPVSGIRSDGLDRICVQHRLNAGGPWFASDNNQVASPYKSFLMNPFENNSLGGPGRFYLADGDYLVRIVVNYDFPDGNSSAMPPAPELLDVTSDAGILDANNATIKATDVSIIDFDADGYDDIAIGANIFKNQKDGTFKNVSSGLGIIASATSWADIDNDGDLDFYALANGGFITEKLMVESRDKIYINENGNFKAQNPLLIFNKPYPNPSTDFNLTQKFNQDSLPNPYSCISPVWFDFNSDGWLDLFIANNRTGYNDKQGNYREVYYPDQLWISNNGKSFTNARLSSQLAKIEPFVSGGYLDCYGAAASDFNNDYKSDLFVANYRLAPDFLLKNNGNSTFSDVAEITGVRGVPTFSAGYFGHGMGCEWADFNNDGLMDICVGNLGHPDWRGASSNPSLIYVNEGPPDYKFKEVHSDMGLKFFEMNSGVCWADLDNDGFQDLIHGQISYEAKGSGANRFARVYKNLGSEYDFKLKDMTWIYGSIIHGAWSIARIDYDNDGDLDLIMASGTENLKLYRNDLTNQGYWVSFRLLGDTNSKVNLNCYGTKVYILDNQDRILFSRELNGSASGTRGSQNSSEIHFGLGNLEKIDRIKFAYPNGMTFTFDKIDVNRKYHVKYSSKPAISSIAAPRLCNPANKAVSLKRDEAINFSFYPVQGASSYWLILLKKSGNKFDTVAQNLMLLSGIQKTSTPIKLKDCGQYKWYVIAMSSIGSAVSSEWEFTVCAPMPEQIKLRLPENIAEGISVFPEFEWEAAKYNLPLNPRSKYKLQISTSDNFSDLVHEKSEMTDLNYTMEIKLEPDTKYYWRIEATNDDSDGLLSDSWSFRTSPLPAKPDLVEPENESKDISTLPRFRWAKAEWAKNYDLQVAEDSDFNQKLFEKNHTWISYTLQEPLQPNKKHYWRVRANNDGGPGVWSSIYSFETGDASSITDPLNMTHQINAYPNPFDEDINVNLMINEISHVKIKIFNLYGEIVSESDLGTLSHGLHELKIDAVRITSGAYVMTIRIGLEEFQTKMIKL